MMQARIIFLIIILCSGCKQSNYHHDLAVSFSGDAKIEVGGPFVGLAFHHSQMIPQRISFYYPVANSIDHSRDYWTRDTSYVMELGLSIGDEPERMIGRQASRFESMPYAVTFKESNAEFSLAVDYRFCNDKPAVVQTISIKNESDEAQEF
ncbi:MAG: hypothetical protein JSU77_13225, partial [Fidelibacterota bacterium]